MTNRYITLDDLQERLDELDGDTKVELDADGVRLTGVSLKVEDDSVVFY